MLLVSRVNHPYILEYKESWVEKVNLLTNMSYPLYMYTKSPTEQMILLFFVREKLVKCGAFLWIAAF
jgi:hypothetical protein